MNSYIDVVLKPDAELREAELSSKVFTKFHKGLVALKTDQIGISFPKVRVKLGLVYRLHGNVDKLKELQELNWLGPLIGYCNVSDICPIPEIVQHRNVREIRSNLSSSKLRRLVTRGSIDKQGEKRYKIKMLSNSFDNPYLDILSSSTGQVYRKFFYFGEVQAEPIVGPFDSYGLSKSATIPWF
ncbi:type I-F CRISPR-associated endoribonuclease Cas6/Csy4 [Alteromonas mediterranea]|uniref:Type I-F CRISPR-associated endoribonuclease Cas6/Csy4 n=1 Tax=Alteromonas mediterranea TaxID=314275 RepID=A0AAC9NR59_9ALTE|nr:type I-F CRISPR-associated endoribonuclease Cas6/Csy4 [Alteromonas mediterranea]APD89012.1 type I-F CRISPR-associated endoribonuclease Cas6/Csy4 [Alteromonas mediterranea]APD96829.1 type I-F CRISPR-associated endoribonuclease Cas6/Csy4 [Alteromonas mediterranea]